MLIGILGRMGSGKGTVAENLVKTHGFRQDSFAATLKDITSILFNWDRAMLEGDTPESREQREEVDEWWSQQLNIPNFTPRYALQYIGTEVFRNNFHPDIWVLSVMARYEDEDIVVSDVRFPNEVKIIQDMGGILVQVERGDEPEWWKFAKLAAAGNESAGILLKSKYGIHSSEWAWAMSEPDEVIRNDGTLEDLYSSIQEMLNKYKN